MSNPNVTYIKKMWTLWQMDKKIVTMIIIVFGNIIEKKKISKSITKEGLAEVERQREREPLIIMNAATIKTEQKEDRHADDVRDVVR